MPPLSLLRISAACESICCLIHSLILPSQVYSLYGYPSPISISLSSAREVRLRVAGCRLQSHRQPPHSSILLGGSCGWRPALSHSCPKATMPFSRWHVSQCSSVLPNRHSNRARCPNCILARFTVSLYLLAQRSTLAPNSLSNFSRV